MRTATRLGLGAAIAIVGSATAPPVVVTSDLTVRSWPCGQYLDRRCLTTAAIHEYDARKLVVVTEAVVSNQGTFAAQRLGLRDGANFSAFALWHRLDFKDTRSSTAPAVQDWSTANAKEAYEAWRDHRDFHGQALQEVQREVSVAVATASSEFARNQALFAQLTSMSASIEAPIRDQLVELAPLRDFTREPRDVEVDLGGTAIERNLRELDGCIASGQVQACGEPYSMLSAPQIRTRPDIASRLRQLEDASGVLRPEAIVPSAPPSPFAAVPWQSQPQTPAGRLVRQVASEFQLTWAESEGLQLHSDVERAAFAVGVAFVASADRHASLAGSSSDNWFRGELTLARTLLDVSRGFVSGFAAGVRDAAALLPAAAKLLEQVARTLRDDPQAAVAALARLPELMPQVAAALKSAAVAAWGTIESGSPTERAELVGRLAFEAVVAVATGGAATWAKGTATGATIANRMNTAGRALWAATGERLGQSTLRATGNRWLSRVIRPDTETGRILASLVKADPDRALRAVSAYERLQTFQAVPEVEALAAMSRVLGMEAAAGPAYVDRLLRALPNPKAGLSYIKASEVGRIVGRYDELAKRIGNVAAKPFVGETWRAVQPTVRITDEAGRIVRVIKNTEETVFDLHSGLASARARYGLPGPEGQPVLSATVGARTRAWETAFDEIDSHIGPENANELIVASRRIEASKVLDLTDSSVRAQLGVTLDDLRVIRDLPGSYEVTHILGDIAKQAGYEAIVAPSAASTTAGSVIHVLVSGILR